MWTAASIDKNEKYQYKEQYEQFKLIVNLIGGNLGEHKLFPQLPRAGPGEHVPDSLGITAPDQPKSPTLS